MHGSGFVDTDSRDDDDGGGGEYRELRLDFISILWHAVLLASRLWLLAAVV
jgi:hypothetical protein